MLKFGGTSVASADRWRRIAQIVESRLSCGERPLLVCSALAGISDLLLALLARRDAGAPIDDELASFRIRHQDLARELDADVAADVHHACERIVSDCGSGPSGRPLPAAARAEVLANGELLSSRIGARFLASRGLGARWIDARDLLTAQPTVEGTGVREQYLAAMCEYDPDEALASRLDGLGANAVVTQGFIARNRRGETVLLGRGGSDTAASYFAAKLGARRLEIWSDVPGIFTADPRHVPSARLIHELDYDEAETFAGLGARVLHPRAILPAQAAGVPIFLRWTDDPDGSGTIVRENAGPEHPGVRGIASRSDLCLLLFNRQCGGWQPIGFMADVASCFKRLGLSMDLIASSPTSIQATLDLSLGDDLESRVPELLRELERIYDPRVDYHVASISVIGKRLSEATERLVPVLEVLREKGLRMLTHAADDRNFTLVVEQDESRGLVQRLHARLLEAPEWLEGRRADLGPSWEELQRTRSAPADTRPASRAPT